MPLITSDALDKLVYIVVGAILTQAFQQYRLARSEDIALMNEHIKEIEKFGEAARDYWLKAPASSLDEELAAAAKVRAAQAATALLYADMIGFCSNRGDDYKNLSLELFSVATGGSFESLSRKIDPVRAIDAHEAAARLVHLVRSSRKDILSVKRAIALLYNKICIIDFKA
ncbi:hypothetical protein [Rhizobium miluonense]|uniref:Uncharacterized protein n=1 Tax=Rhizobium miluonense TaxID=411945 RepID=A0ABU1SML2_9HYPH|nr:hypothetical protein [Rhizobium miluonense]MDR6900198.1 hypothetical protein [Rhizobium miluonense]